MANDYFDSADYTPPSSQTLARASQILAILQAIEAGFDKLPSETGLKQGRATWAGTAGGAANAYTVELPSAPAAYAAGLHIAFIAPASNTGASTINVDGLGTKSIIRPDGSALSANDIPINSVIELRYDGTNFQLVAPGIGATGASVSATAAAASATAAANSASNAATSATAAAASASAAALSAAAAESASTGMKWRDPVQAATTANITLSGEQTIDGVSVGAGDRVLVKDQSDATENGVYVAAAGAWSRATDADSWAELTSQVVSVEAGTANGDLTFITTIDAGGTLDTDDVTWTEFTIVVGPNAIGTAQIQDEAVTEDKLSSSAISFLLPPGFGPVPYCGSTAPTGWVLASGRTIGDASSGATERANADTENLFTVLWNSWGNTELPIQNSSGSTTTRGASASADFAAHKRLPVPDARGRVIAGLDNIGGTSADRLAQGDLNPVHTTMGGAAGVDVHTLTTDQIPSHTHSFTGNTALSGSGGAFRHPDGGPITFGATNPTGGGGAHTNLQPTLLANSIIKL